MTPKKVILLDLGGVVFQSTGRSNHKIDWKIITCLNEKYGPRMDVGENAFPEFLLEYNHLTEQELEKKEFLENVFHTLDFNQELIDMLKSRWEIIIVSDNYRQNISYISQRYSFSDWAADQRYSYDYKHQKADPVFFELLLKDLNQYGVNELLLIDDSMSKIDSAAKSGIDSILYHDNEQVKEALEKYSSPL